MDRNDSAKLARIDERVVNLDRMVNLEKASTAERFDRTFKFVEDGMASINDRFDKVDEKLGELWDIKNKQDGAFGLGKIVAGGIGGLLVAAIDFIIYGGGHIK